MVIRTASSEFGTYRLCEQRRFRRTCASVQSRQNLRCSLIQAMSQEEPSDRKPDPWPLWMAGHAQLKFVMTECSKTQNRLTGLNYKHIYQCDGYLTCSVLVCFGLCWGLTSQSTSFQSCRDGATASWVINQYFRGVKCLAQGHNTAAVGFEPPISRSGVRHSTTEPPRSPSVLVNIKEMIPTKSWYRHVNIKQIINMS